jgi:putative spermidine/putrescine transport system substrate-binding protein
MSKKTIGRRTTLSLLGAGLMSAPFIRPSHGQAAWPEQTSVPDILKA